MGTAVLEMSAVHKAYRRGPETVQALRGVDLTLFQGEAVALVGRSGSGKSTLGHLAGGLDRPDRGEVRLDGADLAALSARDLAGLRRQRVGFVFQLFHLMGGLSVSENVTLPLLLAGRRPDPAAVGSLLDSVGLAHRADHLPGQLSGGEMQRAAIARALVNDPAVVVADEPTGNLDSAMATEILKLLLDRVRHAGSTLLFITHDAKAARRADRVVRLEDGTLA